MSKAEKALFHKKVYYKALVPFLLFSAAYIVTSVMLVFTNELLLRLSLLFAPVFCMCVTIFWYNLVTTYNKVQDALYWERLDKSFKLPPDKWLFFIIIFILPMFNFFTMIPTTLFVLMKMPCFSNVAFGDVIFFTLCWICNTLIYIKLNSRV